MKRLLTIVLSVAALTAPLFAQTFTPVSGTILDQTNQHWGYATVIATLYNPSSTLPPVFTATGAPVQTTYVGGTDQNGNIYSIDELPDNAAISPAGSSWVFTLYPNTTSPAVTTQPIYITGTGGIDLTSYFTYNLTGITSISGVSLGMAYNINNIQQSVQQYTNGFTWVETDPNSDCYLCMYQWQSGSMVQITAGPSGGAPAACNSIGSDYVCTDPNGSQTILQPINTTLYGTGNFAFGYPADDDIVLGGGGTNFNNFGHQNTVIGFDSFSNPSLTAQSEIVLGYGTANQDSAGSQNILIGVNAASNLTTSESNTCVGSGAMYALSSDSTGANTCFGYDTLSSTTGHLNSAFGAHAGKASTGSGNIYIGPYAGSSNASDTYSNQLFINSASGANSTTANDENYSLIWGTFNGSPGSYANTQWTVNAQYMHFPHINSTPCPSGGLALYTVASSGLANGVETDSGGCAVIGVAGGAGISVSRTNNTVTVTNTAVPSATWADAYVNISGCAFANDGNGLFCSLGSQSFSPAMSDTSYSVSCTINFSNAMMTTTSALPTLYASGQIVDTSHVTVQEALNNGSSTGFGIATNYGATVTCHLHHN